MNGPDDEQEELPIPDATWDALDDMTGALSGDEDEQ